jgi:phosphoribosylanthranilate isomerase
VDVCTGVEVRPGIKDPKKIRSFIRRAKQIE